VTLTRCDCPYGNALSSLVDEQGACRKTASGLTWGRLAEREAHRR
jgi:hypothetical protein